MSSFFQFVINHVFLSISDHLNDHRKINLRIFCFPQFRVASAQFDGVTGIEERRVVQLPRQPRSRVAARPRRLLALRICTPLFQLHRCNLVFSFSLRSSSKQRTISFNLSALCSAAILISSFSRQLVFPVTSSSFH